MFSRRSLFSGLVLAALMGLVGCAQNQAAPSSSFTLLDGKELSTSGLKGKVYLVNFWATTCTSCVAEMPELVKIYERFKDQGFDTVAVAMQYDPPAWVNRFATSRQLPFKVALDHTGNNAKEWGDIRLTPTTFLVDKSGQIIKQFVGPPDFDALHDLIDRLLKSAPVG